MNRVSVTYAVPVQVFVDLDEGTVTQVVVCDEEVSRDRNLTPAGNQPTGPNGTGIPANDYLVVRPYSDLVDSGDDEPTPEQIEAAYEIADHTFQSGDCPAWRIGDV